MYNCNKSLAVAFTEVYCGYIEHMYLGNSDRINMILISIQKFLKDYAID